MRSHRFSLQENLLGFIQPYFVIGSGLLLLCSLFLWAKVDANRFCPPSAPTTLSCVPCPEHAECEGLEIVRCDHGLLNDGYQCLYTTLDEAKLAALHDQIISEYSKNTTRTAEEIYSLFSESVFPSDFNSALAYHGRYQKAADGRIAHNLFAFVRTRSPPIRIRTFVIFLGLLFAFSLTGTVMSKESQFRENK